MKKQLGIAIAALALTPMAACSTTASTPSASQTTSTITTTTTAKTSLPPAGSSSSVASPTTAAAPSTSASASVAVNPADYADGKGTFFSSPTGNIICGWTEQGTMGCQARVPVDNMPQCGSNPDQKAAIATITIAAGTTTIDCTAQGIYGGPSGPGKALPYGSSITRDGIMCESSTAGISCYAPGTNGGFIASREKFRGPGGN